MAGPTLGAHLAADVIARLGYAPADAEQAAAAVIAAGTATAARNEAVDLRDETSALRDDITALAGAAGFLIYGGLDAYEFVTDADGAVLEYTDPDGERFGTFWDELKTSEPGGGGGGAGSTLYLMLEGLDGTTFETDADGTVFDVLTADGRAIDDPSDFPRWVLGSNGVIAYGQSLSEAYLSIPALTTAPTANVEMFEGGVRADADGGGVAGGAYDSIVNAAESNSGIYGEVGLVRLGERLFAETGRRALVVTCGKAATDTIELSPGASPVNYFARVEQAVEYGFSLNDARGKSFQVAGMVITHGHKDAAEQTNPLVYAGRWQAILDATQALVKAKGQASTLPAFFAQYTCYRTSTDKNHSTIGIAQHQLSQRDRRFIITCPTYILPHPAVSGSPGTYDTDHLSNVGSILLNQYAAIAMKRTLVDRVRWRPLAPLVVRGRPQIERQGKFIFCTFDNPTGTALQLNTSRFADPGDYGFSAIGPDGSDLGLEGANFEIAGNTLVMPCAGAVPAGFSLRAGYVGGYPGDYSPNTLQYSEPVVCLSDTSAETVSIDAGSGPVTWALHNYCLHFDIQVFP